MSKWIIGYSTVLVITGVMAFSSICGPIAYLAQALFTFLSFVFGLALLSMYRKARKARTLQGDVLTKAFIKKNDAEPPFQV